MEPSIHVDLSTACFRDKTDFYVNFVSLSLLCATVHTYSFVMCRYRSEWRRDQCQCWFYGRRGGSPRDSAPFVFVHRSSD